MSEEWGTVEWREIPGFDGDYEITRQGEVRSWKEWRGCKKKLPRAMRVQVRARGRRYIQLGLYGGTHNVADLVERVFGPKEDQSTP